MLSQESSLNLWIKELWALENYLLMNMLQVHGSPEFKAILFKSLNLICATAFVKFIQFGQDPKFRRPRAFWRENLVFHWRKISYFIIYLYIYICVCVCMYTYICIIYIYIYICVYINLYKKEMLNYWKEFPGKASFQVKWRQYCETSVKWN